MKQTSCWSKASLNKTFPFLSILLAFSLCFNWSMCSRRWQQQQRSSGAFRLSLFKGTIKGKVLDLLCTYVMVIVRYEGKKLLPLSFTNVRSDLKHGNTFWEIVTKPNGDNVKLRRRILISRNSFRNKFAPSLLVIKNSVYVITSIYVHTGGHHNYTNWYRPQIVQRERRKLFERPVHT